MPSDNQLFLDEASKRIRSEENHLLRFLLKDDRSRVRTLEGGNVNIYDKQASAIYEGRANEGKLVEGMKPKEIAAELGVSVSCDACHTTTKQHGTPERFALGIAEDNRSHGRDEAAMKKDGYAMVHDAIDIGGVPVIKESAQKWQEAGLLPKGTVEQAPSDRGWCRAEQKQQPTPEAPVSRTPTLDELRADAAKQLQELQDSLKQDKEQS